MSYTFNDFDLEALRLILGNIRHGRPQREWLFADRASLDALCGAARDLRLVDWPPMEIRVCLTPLGLQLLEADPGEAHQILAREIEAAGFEGISIKLPASRSPRSEGPGSREDLERRIEALERERDELLISRGGAVPDTARAVARRCAEDLGLGEVAEDRIHTAVYGYGLAVVAGAVRDLRRSAEALAPFARCAESLDGKVDEKTTNSVQVRYADLLRAQLAHREIVAEIGEEG